MRKKVWVVEILNDSLATPRWEATVGVRLTKREGADELREWKTKNSGRFRLMCYVAVAG